MFDIITSLLDINKIEEGRVNIKYEVASANGIIETLIKQNIESAKRKEIVISFNKLEEDAEFNTDRTLIIQILDNLLSNAIKFSPIGKPIEINILNDKDTLTFEVKDNGPGLSDGDKQNLFKKFVKLSARPTAGEHSTGLGLSISKKITEMLGGNIFVESEVGNGAKFILQLPK
jgi:signal transduction histidine kinase